MNTIDILQSTPRTRKYLDLWVQLISEHLSKIIRAPVTAEAVAGEDPSGCTQEGSEGGIWIRFAADRTSEQAFFLTKRDALLLAQSLSGGPDRQDISLSSDGQKAVGEFFSQIAARIPMADWLGFDTELKASGSEKPEWSSPVKAAFHFSTPQGSLLVLRAQISTELALAIQSSQETSTTTKNGHSAIGPNPFHAALEATQNIRLELLMDVELEVILRFGQREMLLRDVLNLTPGTVLELDQQIQDPVELLVGNKVIAWGEVVAVDGNYGLRITSLASREERLESLRK